MRLIKLKKTPVFGERGSKGSGTPEQKMAPWIRRFVTKKHAKKTQKRKRRGTYKHRGREPASSIPKFCL